MTDWKEVRSSDTKQPAALDITSSATTVYERKNIHQETSHDEQSNTDITYWVYDERSMTKDEYATLHSPTTQLIMQNFSDIEADLLDLLFQEV